MAGLILEPLASAYGVLTEEEMEAGAVVVDIGGGTTDIALFHDGILRYTAKTSISPLLYLRAAVAATLVVPISMATNNLKS